MSALLKQTKTPKTPKTTKKCAEDDFPPKTWSNKKGEIFTSNIIPKVRLNVFMGRANPPHDGHYENFINMIENYKTNEEKNNQLPPLIMLGNGTGKFDDDPLDSVLKTKIINDYLSSKGYVLGTDYNIITPDIIDTRYNKPIGGRFLVMIDYYLLRNSHPSNGTGLTKNVMYIVQYAGGKSKDDPKDPTQNDSVKLNFIYDCVETADVLQNGEASAQSSSAIKKFARQKNKDGTATTIDDFIQKYGTIYGVNASQVFNQLTGTTPPPTTPPTTPPTPPTPPPTTPPTTPPTIPPTTPPTTGTTPNSKRKLETTPDNKHKRPTPGTRQSTRLNHGGKTRRRRYKSIAK